MVALEEANQLSYDEARAQFTTDYDLSNPITAKRARKEWVQFMVEHEKNEEKRKELEQLQKRLAAQKNMNRVRDITSYAGMPTQQGAQKRMTIQQGLFRAAPPRMMHQTYSVAGFNPYASARMERPIQGAPPMPVTMQMSYMNPPAMMMTANPPTENYYASQRGPVNPYQMLYTSVNDTSMQRDPPINMNVSGMGMAPQQPPPYQPYNMYASAYVNPAPSYGVQPQGAPAYGGYPQGYNGGYYQGGYQPQPNWY
jgi:hypothetical protein